MKFSGPKAESMFDRLYFIIFGIGIVIFGISAVVDREYNSLIYGIIDLGPYHVIIGISAFVIGLLFVFYFPFKDLNIK